MNVSFAGPRRKVERANQHINEIESRYREFVTNKANRIVTDFDPASGLHKVRLEIADSLSDTINLAFGDAVHNLRAALDYTWAQAILAFDPNVNIANLSFPLANETRDGCKGSINAGKVEHAVAIATVGGQKLRDLIVDTIQPYGTWDTPL